MTDHKGEAVVDLEQQGKIRSKQIKAVGRLLREVQDLQAAGPAISYSLLNIRDKSNELSSILRRATTCMELIFDEEDEEDNITEDERVRAVFNKQVEAVRNVCQDMGALKHTSHLAQTVEESIQAVEELVAADATTDCSACLPDIQKQLDEMSALLRDSTIKPTENMWQSHKLLTARLLKVKSHPREEKPPIILKSEKDRDFDTPKVNIPKFKGGLEARSVFWGRYKAAVHENDKLREAVKMAILLDLMDDPSLKNTSKPKVMERMEGMFKLSNTCNTGLIDRGSCTRSIVNSFLKSQRSKGPLRSFPGQQTQFLLL